MAWYPISNLDALVSYSMNPENIMIRKMALGEGKDKRIVDDTKKAILKIWDHVNLANQQYKILKQTDDEYTEKFKRHISSYKEEMTKEMNAQLLTMVSIFTALAFLIFWGISSLDSIFSIDRIPIMKLLSIGLIWGICIFNLIFLFLFCVSKMTKLDFKSNSNPDATIFQKYPVVWWCNLILISLLLICLWVYFVQQHKMAFWIINICVAKAECVTIGGCVLIALIILKAVKWLAKVTGLMGNKR